MRQSDIYNMIEENVMNQLKNGIIPWRRCYHVNNKERLCYSHTTGKPYSVLNQILLEQPGAYWTFNQVKSAGLSLRKGCHASKVVFWKVSSFADKKVDKSGEVVDTIKCVPLLKWYNVFHERDVIGLPQALPDTNMDPVERERRNAEVVEKADEIVRNYLSANKDISLVTSDRTPCFAPSMNTIFMPEKSQFDSILDYYDTAFHEIIHSTRKALGRDKTPDDAGRAREELVAEIGGAFLCGRAGIQCEDLIKNNAAYCASWMQALGGNIRHLVWASVRAETAAKFVLNELESEQASDEDEEAASA